MSGFARPTAAGSASQATQGDSASSALSQGINFFRRVKDAVVRPVPGVVKGVLGQSGAPSSSSSAGSRTGGGKAASEASGGAKPAASGAGKKPAGGSAQRAGEAGAGKASSSSSSSSSSSTTQRKPYRIGQFDQIMESENVDLAQLRKLSWNGVPAELRPKVWQIMLGYVPTNKNRRDLAVERKRKEYIDSIPLYFDTTSEDDAAAAAVAGGVSGGGGGGSHGGGELADRTTQEGELLRQILVDLPRTSPDLPFFQQAPIQKMMERILYIWSVRHPASGYVQGMNDLLTPLLLVAMQPYASDKTNALRCDVATIPATALAEVEADAYWSLTKLLDNIQDHYTFSQPGLQRMVLRLEDVMRRHSPALDKHFQDEGIQYMQFAFRWMNCLLLRELPLKAVLRLWDTYLAEERAGFENFHVYVCAVFLKEHEERLLKMSFQEILMFLQDLPTGEWVEEDIEPILSQAYILSTLYDDSAAGHLA